MNKHIFKPGDRAFDVEKTEWVELQKNVGTGSRTYPLEVKGGTETYTEDGRYYCRDTRPVLFPYNPMDLSDPNNPPGLVDVWPFMLRGQKLVVGMKMMGIFDNAMVPVRIKSLELLESNYCVTCSWDNWGVQIGVIHPDNLLFPDELPAKKKVAKWVYPICGIPGTVTVGFTEEMTEEDARKAYGSSIQMIPGTEREVGG